MGKTKNVIVVMADTLQYNYLGCYGNSWIKTPNYDNFALQSTLFENCYSEANPTVPCRRSMLTGCYTLPFAGWGPLRPEDTTVADILWGTGVQTGLVYDSAPMRLPKYGYSRGFDYVKFYHGGELDSAHYAKDKLYLLDAENYIGEGEKKGMPSVILESMKDEMVDILKPRQYWRGDEDTQVAKLMKGAMNYLENEVDRSKPFFLWVDSFDPHEPWDPPSVYDPGRDCPYDPGYKGKDQILPIPGLVEDRFTEKELHHIRMLYAEKITMVDKWLGKFLDKVRSLGLWDDTLIILVSDHGEPLGNGEHGHGLMRKFRPWPYEELVHIPLMVRVPGVGEGKRINSFAQSCDLAPTILDYLGFMKKEVEGVKGFKVESKLSGKDMTGASLLPLVSGQVDKVRDFAIAGYFGFSWSMITEDYSYVHWLKDITSVDTEEVLEKVFDNEGLGEGTKGTQTEEMWTCTPHAEVVAPATDELYDRRNDVFQLKNIISKKPEVASELLKKLKLFIGELRTR